MIASVRACRLPRYRSLCSLLCTEVIPTAGSALERLWAALTSFGTPALAPDEPPLSARASPRPLTPSPLPSAEVHDYDEEAPPRPALQDDASGARRSRRLQPPHRAATSSPTPGADAECCACNAGFDVAASGSGSGLRIDACTHCREPAPVDPRSGLCVPCECEDDADDVWGPE